MHPTTKIDVNDKKLILDHSPTSIEWILKCRRIVSCVSNTGFEALLFGKTSYVISDHMPYSYLNPTSLKSVEECTCNLIYLNYFCFVYFVPYHLMFNSEYIRFRLKNPSVIELFHYHQNFLVKEKKLTIDKINLKEILRKYHKLTEEKTLDLLQINHGTVEKKLVDEKMELELCAEVNKKEKEELEYKILWYQDQINLILNSKSWKVTKPLRTVSKKMKHK